MKKANSPAEEAATETGPAPSEESSPPAGDPGPASSEPQMETDIEADLSGQLHGLRSEFEALNDRHLRLAAEFSNYRRRAEAR